ncbi:unnamed protein product [Ilex paraguariensis]|uniref:N-acetyltransferase ESCO zinc-finger domain-containing protein n=1 Tax=Ilex paraguariensis TaxID=185542 RepID=A0ABC8TQN2_9AQUA
MQAKIGAFFKPQPTPKTLNQTQLVSDQTNSTDPPHIDYGTGIQQIEAPKECCIEAFPLEVNSVSTKILNKKRRYGQLHLDLGQSDFLLHTCSVCGFKYARGDEEDEKVHKELHKEYTQGIQFKGWHNERVIHVPSTNAGRIVLVLDGDPPAHKKKVQKVVEMMEMELGIGWLIHKLCKVYLFISHHRIAGCLVAEPIKSAYRVLPNTVMSKGLGGTTARKNSLNFSALQFGDISFQREAVKGAPLAIVLSQ